MNENGEYPQPSLAKEERKQFIEEILESGTVEVKLSPPFDKGERRQAVLEALFIGPWLLPNEANGNKIFARGGSVHELFSPELFASTSLVLPFNEKLDIVIKPAGTVVRAENEIRNLEMTNRLGGIRVGKPLGMVVEKGGKEAFVLTLLESGVVPLENLRIENMQEDDQERILGNLAGAVATMHNLGIIHFDLHLGNIAYDPRSHEPKPGARYPYPQIVFFDFEKAQVIARHSYHDPINARRKIANAEEGMIKDLAKVYVHLTEFSANLDPEFVSKAFVHVYCDLRSKNRQDICGKKGFKEKFDEECSRIKNKEGRRVHFFRGKKNQD